MLVGKLMGQSQELPQLTCHAACAEGERAIESVHHVTTTQDMTLSSHFLLSVLLVSSMASSHVIHRTIAPTIDDQSAPAPTLLYPALLRLIPFSPNCLEDPPLPPLLRTPQENCIFYSSNQFVENAMYDIKTRKQTAKLGRRTWAMQKNTARNPRKNVLLQHTHLSEILW